MAYDFPSDEWVVKYKEAINTSEAYREAGAKWEAGPITLVVSANPDIGLDEDYYIWLELYHGECIKAEQVTEDEGSKANFIIRGDYARWKQVVKGELDPVKGMMQGKLKLKGDLPTIVRFVKASNELVRCAQNVDTHFIDE